MLFTKTDEINELSIVNIAAQVNFLKFTSVSKSTIDNSP